MNVLFLTDLFVVAVEAELGQRRLKKEFRVRRLMRVVAEDTIPGGHGPMDCVLGVLGIMAHVTDHVPGIGYLKGAVTDEFVTDCTLTRCKRGMDRPAIRGFGQIFVAFQTDFTLSIRKSCMPGFCLNPRGKENQNHAYQNV